MDKIEKVKNILNEIFEWLGKCRTTLEDNNFSRAMGIDAIHQMERFVNMKRQEICQLFPKSPDNTDGYKSESVKLPQIVGKGGEANDEPKPESRLLTDKEFMRRIHYVPSDKHDIRIVSKYQRDLTASIISGQKDAECQARVDRLLKEIEDSFIWGQVPYHDISMDTMQEWTMHCISDEDWQELKEREGRKQ